MSTIEDCASIECMLMDANELAQRMLEVSDALNRLIGTLGAMVDEKVGQAPIDTGGCLEGVWGNR